MPPRLSPSNRVFSQSCTANKKPRQAGFYFMNE
jgi:hypothetical protein